MNRQLLSLAAMLVIGTCILAEAAEPELKSPPTLVLTAVETAKPSATNTPYQFPGKLVRVQMTGGARNEFFVLENATLTPLNPMNGSEWFLVGTGIKNGPRQTSWCEGLEVHLNLHLVASYCPLTPEQWKDQQRYAPRFGPSQTAPSQPTSDTTAPAGANLPLVPIQPTAGTDSTPLDGMIPLPPQTPAVPPIPPTRPAGPVPTTPGPEAGPPLVFPNPQVVPNPLLPIQPATGPSPTSGTDTQLKTAQDERVKLLTQVVEILTSQYKVATVDYSQVASAESDLCNAQLDSTDEPEKRIALLTKQLERANDCVKLMQGRFDAGSVTDLDLSRAKVLCLDVKIKLLREGGSKRPSTPTATAKRP